MKRPSTCGIKWTDKEESILREQWNEVKYVKPLAEILGKTPDAVKKKAARMGLPKKRFKLTLTAEQKAEFIRLYPTTPNRKLARMFGLDSCKTLQSKAWRMGLRKKPVARPDFTHKPMNNVKPEPAKPIDRSAWAVYSNRSPYKH